LDLSATGFLILNFFHLNPKHDIEHVMIENTKNSTVFEGELLDKEGHTLLRPPSKRHYEQYSKSKLNFQHNFKFPFLKITQLGIMGTALFILLLPLLFILIIFSFLLYLFLPKRNAKGFARFFS